MAFLVLLESLAPAERAVFLLREVFGYDYSEIAGITGKTEAACRQTFTRARRRIDEGRPRFETSRAEGDELTALFLAAADGGDMTSLLERLAPDVVFYGDSGGKGETTFIAPVLRSRPGGPGDPHAGSSGPWSWVLDSASTWVNGQPGVLARDTDGDLIAVIAFDVLDGQMPGYPGGRQPGEAALTSARSRAPGTSAGASRTRSTEVSRPRGWLRRRGRRRKGHAKGKESCESSSRAQPG